MCWNLKCHAWLKLKWAPHKWCQSNFSVYIFAVCPSFRVYLSSISTICNINFYCVCVITSDSTIQCRVSELSTRERIGFNVKQKRSKFIWSREIAAGKAVSAEDYEFKGLNRRFRNKWLQWRCQAGVSGFFCTQFMHLCMCTHPGLCMCSFVVYL